MSETLHVKRYLKDDLAVWKAIRNRLAHAAPSEFLPGEHGKGCTGKLGFEISRQHAMGELLDFAVRKVEALKREQS